jgi:Fe-S-cluster containining protein
MAEQDLDAQDDEEEDRALGPTLPLDHPKFRLVEIEVFTRRMAGDCMTHACTVMETKHQRNDICCQYGCDVQLDEKAAIDAHTELIRARLHPDVKHAEWFEPEVYPDADYPSGAVVRTALHDGRCIFTAHDQRGCAIHRTALEEGMAVGSIKPAICRLFPLSWETEAIVIAEEYMEYSCGHTDGPTLYQLARPSIVEIFGEPLARAMDAVEAQVLASEPKRLPVLR